MRNKLLAAIIFLVLIAAMTYPLAFRIATHIPGFFSTDEPYASIWDYWRVKYSFEHKIPIFKTVPMVAYPFGMAMYASGYIAYLFSGTCYLLSLFITPILLYNMLILANLFLSGFLTYLLVLYLTKSQLSAVLSGTIFAFCPYQFARAWQHMGLTFNQWIPLCLFGAIMLREKYSRRSALIFLSGLLLLGSFDFTILYLTAVALAVFLIYTLVRKPDPAFLARFIAVGAAASLILLPQFFHVLRNMFHGAAAGAPVSAFNTYHRPFQDLFTQSAKPLSYFLPATAHPLFGRFTEQFIGSPLYGVSYTEHALYLGWVPLVLAFIAFRRRRGNFYIGFFIWLAIAAWLFSQPPYFTFPDFKIYMPSFFIYKVLPMMRAYCRFGIVLMLAIAVLAGFGLKFILERLKGKQSKIIFASLMCSLVLFEFWNWPPFKVIDLTKYPKVYDWLRQEKGDFAVAEYPLDTQGPNEYYKFCQTVHEKNIINGTIPGTHGNDVAKTINRLSNPETVKALSRMRVKYVLVHLGSYAKSNDVEVLDELERLKKRAIPGLKFIRNIDEIDVYEIIADKPH